jgi:hypothetical protein
MGSGEFGVSSKTDDTSCRLTLCKGHIRKRPDKVSAADAREEEIGGPGMQ